MSTNNASTTLTDDAFLLLKSIHHATENCILNALLLNSTPPNQNEYITMVRRNFALMCVLHWSTVFGSRGEPSHYSTLFNSQNVKTITGSSIDAASVKTHFQAAIGMNAAQYKKLREFPAAQ